MKDAICKYFNHRLLCVRVYISYFLNISMYLHCINYIYLMIFIDTIDLLKEYYEYLKNCQCKVEN